MGRGHIILKCAVIEPFNFSEKNSYRKILTGQLWRRMSMGGGLAPLQSFWPLKKGIRIFDFRSKKPYPDFLASWINTNTPKKNVKKK